MSHQDWMVAIVINHQIIKQVIDLLLVPALFAHIKARGNAKWKPRMLASVALLWATSDHTDLKDRFKQSRKTIAKIFRWLVPGTSYQGFLKMLHKWHFELMLAIVPDIRVKMKEILPGQWMIAGYVVFAADGSRIELARTESLEDAFSPKRKQNKKKSQKKGKGKGNAGRARNTNKQKAAKKQSAESVAKKENSPQMWLTLVWHVGTGLPWSWRRGPSDCSERAHLQEMLPELPENSLITADAGFVGYDFWKSIIDGGHHFVIRVGANVSLLKKLGYAREYDYTVYLWPDAAAKKKQPPLTLRLITLHNGQHPVHLVTDLNKTQLSDRQAARIYEKRWGIELFFRTFKQTFDRRKLRSRTAKNAELELDWSLLGLWCVCLLGQRELANSGKSPARLSPAKAIDAWQMTLRDWRVRPDSSAESLWNMLRAAVLDDYTRNSSKTSRNYPRKKKRERVGSPKINKANKKKIEAAQQLKQNQRDFWLTA